MYSASFEGGSFVQTSVGRIQTFNYNGIAVDDRTNALYGVVTSGSGTDANRHVISNGDFLYIDRSTGAVYDLGVPSALKDAGMEGGFNVGAAHDGLLYLTNSGTTSDATRQKLWIVDVSTGEATSEDLTPGVVMSSDLTYASGYLWGRADGNGDLLRIDPSTGAITSFKLPADMPSGANQGGAFTFGNGNLGLELNDGKTIQLSIGDAENPTPSVVATYSSASGVGTDAANAISKPVDLAIEKSADQSTVSPDGTLTWTLTVTNTSDVPSSGWVVSDSVPSGYTDVTPSPRMARSTATR